MIKGYIFDLDGVIVDTAKYHYQSWNRLANKLGFNITEEENENLKGVSRMESLEYILTLGETSILENEKIKLAELKNRWYVELISSLSQTDIMPGVKELLEELKSNNLKIALGSASKNSEKILRGLQLIDFFDVIIDGNKTSKSKPHPQVFLLGAKSLALEPRECIVFEDSAKGIQAANQGGFISVGLGDSNYLHEADLVLKDLEDMSIGKLTQLINSENLK